MSKKVEIPPGPERLYAVEVAVAAAAHHKGEITDKAYADLVLHGVRTYCNSQDFTDEQAAELAVQLENHPECVPSGAFAALHALQGVVLAQSAKPPEERYGHGYIETWGDALREAAGLVCRCMWHTTRKPRPVDMGAQRG